MSTTRNINAEKVMHSFLFTIAAILCFTSASFAQISLEPRTQLIRSLLSPNGSAISVNNISITKRNARVESKTSTKHRLAGYVYEIGANGEPPHKLSEVKLSYQLPSAMTCYSFYADDSIEISKYEMDSGFDYNQDDMLSILDGAAMNSLFLRSPIGNIYNHFLKKETRKKIGGKWQVTSKVQGRTQLPYGFEYAETLSSDANCNPDLWEFKGNGEWREGLWVRTVDVAQRECHTLLPKKLWRDISKTNEMGKEVEFMSHYKSGDQYILSYIQTQSYDDKGREIERIENSIEEHRKIRYQTIYDEKGYKLLTGYKWEGSTWQLYTKTLPERMLDGSYQYTTQSFVNGVLQNTHRERNTFDVRGRLINITRERWNESQKQWELESLNKKKYYKDDLLAEWESINKDGTVINQWLCTMRMTL